MYWLLISDCDINLLFQVSDLFYRSLFLYGLQKLTLSILLHQCVKNSFLCIVPVPLCIPHLYFCIYHIAPYIRHDISDSGHIQLYMHHNDFAHKLLPQPHRNNSVATPHGHPHPQPNVGTRDKNLSLIQISEPTRLISI